MVRKLRRFLSKIACSAFGRHLRELGVGWTPEAMSTCSVAIRRAPNKHLLSHVLPKIAFVFQATQVFAFEVPAPHKADRPSLFRDGQVTEAAVPHQPESFHRRRISRN